MSKHAPQPEVEWTIDQAPDDAEVSHPSAPAPRPTVRLFPGLSRRGLAWVTGLVALLLLAALGLWAFTRLGWNRLQAQVAAEIAYEDEQSLAGLPGLVRGLQSVDSAAWLDRRAAEAALGLPAPRPAPHLSPVAEPAQILEFAALGQDRFDAAVVRTYRDSAGQTYRFTLLQRYHTPGPGLWERLPPDEAALLAVSVWQGQRLAVTLPVADQALLAVVLPAVDAYAQQACADWNCPVELNVPLVFTSWLTELPAPSPVAGGAPHPIAFDLALAHQPEPRRLVVGAPSLTGYPLDEAARFAYTQGLSAAVLAHIAGELAGTGRRPADYYLDALIARAERRLGLSASHPTVFAAADYAPPHKLWNVIDPLVGAVPAGETARRAQALAYLDLALAGKPASVDGALLDTLRRRRSLEDWLSPVVNWERFSRAWLAAVQAQSNVETAIPASALSGLAYQCPDRTVLHDGAASLVPVWPVGNRMELFALHPLALSSDGRFLATVGWTANGRVRLSLWDRTQGVWLQAEEADTMLLIGWSAAGDLLYAAGDNGGLPALMRYRPADAAPTRLFVEPLWPDWPALDAVWSADRRALAVTLVANDVPRPALWRVEAPAQVELLAGSAGLYGALSPDGRWLAYVPWASGPDDQPFASAIHLVDLDQKTETELLNRDAIRGGASAMAFFSLLRWSPDSRTLAFLAAGVSGGNTLYTVDTQTRQVTFITGGPGHSLTPVGFSADGRFLAYLVNLGNTSTLAVEVHDRETGQAARLAAMTFDDLRRSQTGLLPAYPTGAVAWSPTGHLLAISGASGIYVADPATGDSRWATLEPCGRVVWYSQQ